MRMREFLAAAAAVLSTGLAPAMAQDWSGQITPYVWGAGLGGDVTPFAGAPTLSFDKSLSEVLEDTDGAFFLSGFAWPVEAIPAHLNALAQLIPSTAAIDGLVRVTQMGATLPEIAPILWHLWALAAGLGLVVLAVETVSPSRPAAPDRGPTAPSDSPAR